MRTVLFSTIVGLASAGLLRAEEWGSIKGQVIYNGAVPAPGKVEVTKDQQHCLAKGPLLKTDLLVDAKTAGVQNVMVWLAPTTKDGKIPIKPELAAVPNQPVVIDQPCCQFEPRITMMRAGQKLTIKNSAPVSHNTHITGNTDFNGSINLNIPAGQALDRTLKAEPRPLMLQCDIHGWMGGRIGVFDHPYFAVTKEDGTFEIKDAPAGNFLIYIQHEKAGWLHTPRVLNKGVGGSKGQPITIPAGSALDLGKIKLDPKWLK